MTVIIYYKEVRHVRKHKQVHDQDGNQQLILII